MRVLLIYLTLMLLFGCGEENQIHIFKQWHLSPKDKTTDIQKSTQLKQFENQLDIYKSLASLIEKGEVKLILAEGCESKIKLSDSELFNGWSMKSLAKYKDSKDFDKIMAPIGMKLKVKYPNLKVLCGDNLELIKENQKAMSDLRGYSSFYFRLVEYQKSDAKKFDLYKKQLQSLFPKTTIEFPIKFALEKSIASLKMFERLIEERNLKFQRLARKHYQKNPAIIIGGLHTNDLRRRFDELKLNYKVYTPKGYENDELKLLDQLKENLNEKINDLTFFYNFIDHLKNKTNFYDLIKYKNISFEFIFHEILLKLLSERNFLLDEFYKAKKIVNRIKPTCVIFQTASPIYSPNITFRKVCIDLKIPFVIWMHGGYGLSYSLQGYDVTDFRFCKNHISYGAHLKSLIEDSRCILKQLEIHENQKILPVGSCKLDYDNRKKN